MVEINERSVEFEDDNMQNEFRIRSRKLLGQKTRPAIINFLLKNKLIKSEKQAMIIVLIGIALFLGLSVYIINSSLAAPGNLFVSDQYGRKLPYEEYVARIKRGEEPFPPLNRNQ